MAVVLTLILTYSFQLDNTQINKTSPKRFHEWSMICHSPRAIKSALVCLQNPAVRFCAPVLELSIWRGLRAVSASCVAQSILSSECSAQVN